MFDTCLWGKWFIGEEEDIQSVVDIFGLDEVFSYNLTK